MNRAIHQRGRPVHEPGGPIHEASSLMYIFIKAAKLTVRNKLQLAALSLHRFPALTKTLKIIILHHSSLLVCARKSGFHCYTCSYRFCNDYKLWLSLRSCSMPSHFYVCSDNAPWRQVNKWMNEFLCQCGHCPCGAYASYMSLKRKTLWGIKTSSLQCGFCKVPCSFQYLKTVPKSVVLGRRREKGHRASPWPPWTVQRSLSASPIWWFFVVPQQSQATLRNHGNVPGHPSAHAASRLAWGIR